MSPDVQAVARSALATSPMTEVQALPASLPAGYAVEIDGVDAAGWDDIVLGFADGSIYQTWAYEAQRRGAGAVSHLVLRKDGDIVAAAQLRIVKLPLLPLGVAYARWGPMWRPRGRTLDVHHLQTMLACLRAEYAKRRGLALRILPLAFEHDREEMGPCLQAARFERLAEEGAQRTLLLPLEAPLDAIRRALEQKWRNCLNRAEKNGLELQHGDDDAIFAAFVALYRQMHDRKQFREASSVDDLRRVQLALPPSAKVRVSLALKDGTPVAGIVCSAIGDMGIYLYGATGDAGMGTNASYLLQWDAVKWMKQRSVRWYNLHGINPQTNPGTYRFKAGLAGRNGVDAHYMGTYQTTASTLARLFIGAASAARLAWRRARRMGRTASTPTATA